MKHLCCALVLCLSAILCLIEQAAALESFTGTADFYQGFDLASGMTETDPTVITLIIGSGQEIETVSGPDIDPLFEFEDDIDLYVGFSTVPDVPFELMGENIRGMVSLGNMSLDAVTDDMLARLDFSANSLHVNSRDLVVILTENNRYIFLGGLTRISDTQVQFTYWNGPKKSNEVPEPSTFILLGIGLLGVIGFMKRTQRTIS